MTVISIPTSQLRYNRTTWPRDAVDEDRIAMFVALIEEGEHLPAIEVLPQADGTYLICDGVHRTYSTIRAGKTEIEAEQVTPEGSESSLDCAYRRALETATRTALPLSRSERKRAALRLIETRTDLSHREVAKLVGVAHSSVDRWAEEVAESATDDDGGASGPTMPTPDQVARRLVGFLARIEESRGLFDLMASKRMGRHLAGAFSERFGGSAIKEAQQFRTWLDQAITNLESEPD